MPYLTWKRVPRRGSDKAHWLGVTATGKTLCRVEGRSGRAYVYRLPNGGCDPYTSVHIAMAACDNIARLANFPEVG